VISPDVFVGGVTSALGLFCCSAAIFNWDWYYELQKARWIQSLCGRTGARVFFGILGLGLIVLGSAIATGTFSGDSSSNGDRSESGSPFPFVEAHRV
jgi:hypothetical protein